MSDSRQRLTGRIFRSFLFLGMILGIVWWLPTLLLHWFPDWGITSQDPWLMDPQDLTWQRAIANMAAKPGFRVIPVALIAVGVVMGRTMANLNGWRSKSFTWQEATQQLKTITLRQSMEWILDGSRTTSLAEYARWLGVVG